MESHDLEFSSSSAPGHLRIWLLCGNAGWEVWLQAARNDVEKRWNHISMVGDMAACTSVMNEWLAINLKTGSDSRELTL